MIKEWANNHWSKSINYPWILHTMDYIKTYIDIPTDKWHTAVVNIVIDIWWIWFWSRWSSSRYCSNQQSQSRTIKVSRISASARHLYKRLRCPPWHFSTPSPHSALNSSVTMETKLLVIVALVASAAAGKWIHVWLFNLLVLMQI